MIFNFTKNSQFTSRMQFKFLGAWITNDLNWDVNTLCIVKKAYARLQLLAKAATYTINKSELKSIYKTHIRSILEQSSCVWNSSLTEENKTDLRRVQKAALRIIMGRDYTDYKNALDLLKFQNFWIDETH